MGATANRYSRVAALLHNTASDSLGSWRRIQQVGSAGTLDGLARQVQLSPRPAGTYWLFAALALETRPFGFPSTPPEPGVWVWTNVVVEISLRRSHRTTAVCRTTRTAVSLVVASSSAQAGLSPADGVLVVDRRVGINSQITANEPD